MMSCSQALSFSASINLRLCGQNRHSQCSRLQRAVHGISRPQANMQQSEKTGGVLVASSLNLDVSILVPRAPLPGETVGGGQVEEGLGGKGANTAVAAALAAAGSVPVRLAAARGEDAGGRMLVEAVRSRGVDVSLVSVVERTRTGAAYIVVDASGENRIIVADGANAEFGKLIGPQLWNAIEKAAIVALHMEIPPTDVASVVQVAHLRGVKVLLNPSPVAQARELDEHAWEKVNFIIANEDEAAFLSGVSGDSCAAGRKLAEKCAPDAVVIVTRGKDSVVLIEGERTDFVDVVPARAVVDTTSAGDTVTGYFAAGIAEGYSVRDALAVAVAAASITVEKRGASLSIPTRDEVEKRRQEFSLSQ